MTSPTTLAFAAGTIVLASAAAGRSDAQQTTPGAAQAAREIAPIDLTGYWVSVVTEDWRYRMVTPEKGDYASVPLNDEGKRVADTWNPTGDGHSCKRFGAAAVMREPGRLHVTWQDANTLKIETDAGTQTRLLHFGESKPTGAANPASDDAGWQGYSVAVWEIPSPARGGGGGQGGRGGLAQPGEPNPALGTVTTDAPAGAGRGRGRGGEVDRPRYGVLKVVTRQMRSGYLRKNGVPYSENAVMTEYFDRHNEPNGDEWFTVTTIVEDPTYLFQPFVTSTHFKRERDGAKWHPTTCGAS